MKEKEREGEKRERAGGLEERDKIQCVALKYMHPLTDSL